MSKASLSSSAPSNDHAQHQEVRELPVAESDKAAESLALAFADDDVAMYFVDTDDTENWSKEEKWTMHGLALTIGPHHDCVALWMPPGNNMDDKLTMFSNDLWMLNDKLSVEGQQRFKEEFLPLLHRTKEEALGKLDNDSWYLVYIGTKPGSRGKGYAKKLIAHVTEQADAEGRVCYLESSNGANPTIYRKHGFETKRSIHLSRGPKPVEMEIMLTKVISAHERIPQPALTRSLKISASQEMAPVMDDFIGTLFFKFWSGRMNEFT
ncbi:MAG: hypothetical protein Q9168_003133 [Polycauliona sp. 1 TL-2023]